MKIKKIFIIALFLVFSLNIYGNDIISVNAEDAKNITIYEEITGLDKLYELARENDGIDLGYEKSETLIHKDGKEDNDAFNVKNYKFRQKLKVEVLDDGITITTYSIVNFFEVIDDGGGGGGGTLPTEYDASNFRSSWDGSIGVKTYSTIYWTETNISGITYVDLVKVDGGWQLYDYHLSITDKSIIVGQTGFTLDNFFQQVSSNLNYSAYTFTYYVPSSWSPVATSAYYAVGITTFCTIVRGTGSWELIMTNHI